MRKTFFISIIVLLFCVAAKAQEKKYIYTDSTLIKEEDIYDSTTAQVPVEENTVHTKENTIEIDTTVYYSQITFPRDSVEAWKNLKSFAYAKYLDSLLKEKKEEQNKKPKTYSEPRGNSWLDGILSSGGLQFFLWLLAAFFVLFILYKLFLTEGTFSKSPKSAIAPPQVAEEIISSESDFTALIKLALKTGNFRLAIRYHYLQTIHKLAGKNLIQLAADKTNYQYVKEITNQHYQNDFAALTLKYEYVWYGEFDIDENIYRKMEPGFVVFNNKL